MNLAISVTERKIFVMAPLLLAPLATLSAAEFPVAKLNLPVKLQRKLLARRPGMAGSGVA